MAESAVSKQIFDLVSSELLKARNEVSKTCRANGLDRRPEFQVALNQLHNMSRLLSVVANLLGSLEQSLAATAEAEASRQAIEKAISTSPKPQTPIK